MNVTVNNPSLRLADAAGLLVQIGGGESRQPHFVGLEPGAEIDHDHRDVPWPLEDGSVLTLVVTNAAEHVEPRNFLGWFDEAWRVLKQNGQIAIVTPYAGSPAWWADPLAVQGLTEATPWYFDPEHSTGLWERYKPRPWKQERVTFHRQGNLEIVMRKRAA